MAGEHSRLFAPSAAHRWMHCAPSSRAVAQYTNESGEAAMEGTAAHWLLEKCLVESVRPEDFLGRTIRVEEERVVREFIVDRDMALNVAMGVVALRELAKRPGVSRVESTISLPHIHSDIFGRVDVWHWGQEEITLADFKYGRVDVDPVENLQLLIYALGVFRAYEQFMLEQGVPSPKRFTLMVLQPRSLAPVPRIKTWTAPIERLLQFEEDLRVAVEAVEDINSPYIMGDWCKYCPALGTCPASERAEKTLGLLLQQTEFSPVQAARILQLKMLMEKKLKDAEKAVEATLLQGVMVHGFKLVTGRKHRQWRDADQAKDALLEAVGVKALAVPTPAQAEKFGNDALAVVEQLAFTPAGAPEVAPETDKRAPYVAKTAEQMFGAPT